MLGVFEGEQLKVCWRVSTNWERTEDELGVVFKNLFYHSEISSENISHIIISSVVPPMLYSLEKMSKKYFGLVPLMVGPNIKSGMNILMDNPDEVGADRIVNAVAGYRLYGGPLIIVDFGTATTYCAISENGDYLGGAISPGISISTEALFARAAKLPRVELVPPPNIIGKNTINSMQSGIVYGFVGQVQSIVGKMKKEFSTEPFVVGTGGMAEVIAREADIIDEVNNLLTLEGLRIIFEINRNQ